LLIGTDWDTVRSTITLTMDRYAHAEDSELAAAVDNLPAIPSCTALAQTADRNGLRLMRIEDSERNESEAADMRKTPGMIAFDEHCKRMSNGEGGIRTLDTLTGISVFETDAFNRSATSPGPAE
jgi:hypothetical protein